jgi:hypothetical protein
MGVYGRDKVKALHEKVNEASKVWVKLENDEDKVVCAFLGEPYGEEVCWNEKLQQNEPYTKEDEKAGRRISAKYSWNVWVISEGNGDNVKPAEPRVRILNLNQRTLTKVLKVDEKYGFDRKFFEIERKGKKGDQKTEYSVLPDTDLSDADKKLFAEITNGKHAEHKMHDLAKAARGAGGGDDDKKSSKSTSANGSSNGKSEAHVAALDELKTRLKAIVTAGRRSDADRFLAKFGIGKVVDLPAKDLEAARAFVDELEGKTAAAPPVAAATEDPFG